MNDLTNRRHAGLQHGSFAIPDASLAGDQPSVNDRLALVLDATVSLLHQDDPYTYLQSMYERLSALLGLEVYFHFATGHGDRLKLAAVGGVDKATAASLEWLDYGEAVCGYVAATRERAIVPDVQQSTDLRTTLIRDLGITAYACFPLVAHETLLGTLSFGTRTRPSFADDEFRLMQAVAHFAAAALERHRGEVERQRLSDSEAAARRELRLLSSARDAIMLRALDGKIHFWNGGAERLYGWPTEEAVGRQFSELLFEGSSPVPDEVQTKVVAEGAWRGELRKVTRDGRTITVESHCSLVRDEAGNAEGILVIDTDITEKKALQKQLLRTHRLDSIGAFAGGLAQDLNNLLLPILTRASGQRPGPTTPSQLPGSPGEIERVQSLTLRLVQLQEEERRHLASELHDELGQILTGLKLLVESAARKLPKVSREIEEAGGLINGMLARVREMSISLRPPMLEDVGIAPSLQWHAERFGRQIGMRIGVTTRGDARRLDADLELAVFRIAQEAITNVARHAPDAEVSISIDFTPSALTVSIGDDGVGFDLSSAEAEHSGGLSGMRERARMHGGSLTIASSTGAGTAVIAQFPLDDRNTRGPS